MKLSIIWINIDYSFYDVIIHIVMEINYKLYE